MKDKLFVALRDNLARKDLNENEKEGEEDGKIGS
jgi:hypothetical protein